MDIRNIVLNFYIIKLELLRDLGKFKIYKLIISKLYYATFLKRPQDGKGMRELL